MSTSLLISDLHLCPEHPEITEKFGQFITEHAPKAKTLYILGDLFDAWVGDDECTPLHLEVAKQLKTLNTAGVAIYLQVGNRDFILGKQFATLAGATLIGDPYLANFNGQPTLLMHGDLLCTLDEGYLKYRRIVHQRWLQKIFLALPLTWRQKIGQKIRSTSRSTNPQKSNTIMDVVQSSIEDYLRQYQCTRLVHGHTHKPGHHHFELDGQPCQRIVLSDWNGTSGQYLEIHNGHIKSVIF